MKREQFYAEMKAGTLRACYLLEGEEEFTKLSALRTLQDKVLQGEFAQLNHSVLENPSAADLIAHAETLPLMADRRFVLVKDSGMLAGRAGAAQDDDSTSSSAGDQDKVCDYVERLPDSVCLAFLQRGKASAVRKLYKRIAKLGGVVTFDPLEQPTLIKWIAQELKRHGKVIDRTAAEHLIFAVGNDMHALHGELQKLAAYAGEADEITQQSIDAVCIKTSEHKVFDLSDALVSRQAERAVALMRDMLREGEQRLMLLALLQRQYRQLLYAKILLEARKSPDVIAKTLGVPPFVARKLQGIAAREQLADIRRAYDLLVDTEFEVKSGQMPEEGSLERAVYRILAWQEERQGA